jgi:hypothetical protein
MPMSFFSFKDFAFPMGTGFINNLAFANSLTINMIIIHVPISQFPLLPNIGKISDPTANTSS